MQKDFWRITYVRLYACIHSVLRGAGVMFETHRTPWDTQGPCNQGKKEHKDSRDDLMFLCWPRPSFPLPLKQHFSLSCVFTIQCPIMSYGWGYICRLTVAGGLGPQNPLSVRWTNPPNQPRGAKWQEKAASELLEKLKLDCVRALSAGWSIHHDKRLLQPLFPEKVSVQDAHSVHFVLMFIHWIGSCQTKEKWIPEILCQVWGCGTLNLLSLHIPELLFP